MFQQICQLEHTRTRVYRNQDGAAPGDSRLDRLEQLLVALGTAARLRVPLRTATAANERRRLAQLLDDLGTAAARAAQPGRAGKDILPRLVPVDGVDNGLEPVLDVPDGAAERVARIVGGDGEAVERRRKGRGQRLVRLRVLERLDEGEVARNLLGVRGLQEQVVRRRRRLRIGKGGRGECRGRDGRGRGGRRRVEVLREGAAEVDDGSSGVDGDAREEGDILAAVRVGGEVGGGRVRQEDEGEGRDLSAALCISKWASFFFARMPYFSSSSSLATSKDSSHPRSTSTLTPPSSSSRDCDASDSDCAPWREQNVNIVAVGGSSPQASSFGANWLLCDSSLSGRSNVFHVIIVKKEKETRRWCGVAEKGATSGRAQWRQS